jgi:hypothetical protein
MGEDKCIQVLVRKHDKKNILEALGACMGGHYYTGLKKTYDARVCSGFTSLATGTNGGLS